MRAARFLVVAGFSALLAVVAAAGTFDSFVAVIDARLGDPTLRPRRAAALRTAKTQLESGRLVFEDARAAFRSAAILARQFPRDAAFSAAEDGAADTVEAAIRADREVLSGYAGVWGKEGRIDRRVRLADADLGRAGRARAPRARLRALWGAARDLRDAYPPQPDFRLVDLNDKTPTSGQVISPRDQYGVISAWYFGRAY
jgi:hypothetical protein